MPLYETLVLARQDISSSQVETMIENLSSLVSENGGSVANTEYWGLRTLAYRVKKNRKGHYVLFHLDAPSAAVQEMERTMGLDDDVLRFMTLLLEEFPEGPSVQMKSRSRDRDDRPGRRDDRPRGDRPPRDDRPKPAEDKPAEASSETPSGDAAAKDSADKTEES